MEPNDEAELQRRRDEIDQQLRQRQRAKAKAQKDEENRQLIAAGAGPRKAKIQALKEATWLTAQGRKRPHSPGSDHNHSQDGEAMAIDQPKKGPKKGNTVKRFKDGDAPEKNSREGGGERKTRSGVKSKSLTAPSRNNVRHAPKSKDSTRNNPSNAQPKAPVVADLSESDSTRPSSPDSNNDDQSKDNDASGNDDDYISGGDEEDIDIQGMTDKHLQEVFDTEVPRDASTLFDDDVDVETASVKSHRSYKSASSVSRPPSSESDGTLADGDMDADSDDNDDNDSEERASSSKKIKYKMERKRYGKRDMAFKAERPTTLRTRRAATVRIDSDVEEETKTNEDWPKNARLNNGGLLHQNPFIRATCRDAIKIVEKTLVVEHAWPELHKAATYKQQVLLEAVEGLVAKDKKYQHIRERINGDEHFVKEIGRWVVDRLSHHRGIVRGLASDRIALFQLGVDEGCAQRVKALLEHDVYVYPGEWGTDSKGNPVWVTKGSKTDVQTYLNPGLVELIRVAFFSNATAFGYKFKDLYVSSHPTDPKPELTIPLVALSATAFFAALWEWRTGQKAKSDNNKNKNERFEGDVFKTVYQRHVETLTLFKTKVNTYHRVMSTLYAKVTEENNSIGADTQGNALAVLDLDGLD